MTVTEFLLARIADDEAYARDWIEHDADHDGTRFGSGRILVDCEARRRIVDLAAKAHEWGKGTAGATAGYAKVIADDTIKLLALPYADHPDYQQEWRP